MDEKLDKILEYLAETKQEITEINQKLVVIENDYGEKINALFDGMEVTKDREERMLEGLNRVERDIEKLWLKIPLKKVR